MITKSDPLFLLIKAMTKEEKRHFKIDAARYQSKGSKDYLRLFDAIDAQRVYNEEAIRKKFKGEPYFKQLKSVKLYLHRQILGSLKNFYNNHSVDIRLSSYLTEIEILFKKRLFVNCANTIKKAKAYAEKYEALPSLLKILEWELRLMDYTNDLNQPQLLKKHVTGKIIEVAMAYTQQAHLHDLYFESRNILHTLGEARTPHEMAVYNHILENPLLHKKYNSFYDELARLTMQGHYAQFHRNFESIRAISKNVLELYEAYPHQIDENINAYFSHIAGLTKYLMMDKKFMAAGKLFEKMTAIYQKKQDKLVVINKISQLTVEIYLFADRGEFSKALELLPKINNLAEDNREELDNIGPAGYIMLYYLYFDIYFRNGDYENAQHYIQKIINLEDSIRLDTQSIARIANLIIQYERREFEHLGYVLRSTYRYLMKKQKLYEPESIVINFIRNSVKFTSEKELFGSLAELKKQILPFANDPFVIDFTLMEWIDSKLEKRGLAEIMKERYRHAVAEEQMRPA